ncbi:hypothetical protein B0H13DRAFT_2333670 [Mycena leptocephala]|nr:hypothetical protein B0H13DRAFT_2333670 [Mycena leptocephala]
MEHICCAAPTPERDPVARAEVLEDLQEWGHQQTRLQEGLHCSENQRVLRPLCEGMDVIHTYLEDILDQDAMMAVERGNGSSLEFFMETAAERALDLVSCRVGDGKHKVCDDLLVQISPDGKRL